EIRVELPTHKELSCLYLSEMIHDQSSLKEDYLKDLRSALMFDFSHSGVSSLTATDEALEKVLRSSDPQAAFSRSLWEKAPVDIALKCEVVGSKLDLYAFNIRSGSLKKFEGVSLVGDRAKDHLQMHKLAGAVLRALFGVEPITTTRLLYSVQH